MNFRDVESNVKTNSKWDIVSRSNLIGEYILKNDFLFAFHSGIDVHNITRDQERLVSNDGNTEIYGGRFESNIQTIRMGFSAGYSLEINKTSNLVFKVNVHQFFINRIKIKQMESTLEQYDIPTDEFNVSTPNFLSSELDNRLDYDKIGYRNKLNINNNSINVSIEYRRLIFLKYHLNIFGGYSPFDQRIYPTTSNKRNIFIFGIRLGYTFSKKEKR
jgi:uncharacterized protein involved in outer membrane biogenesis